MRNRLMMVAAAVGVGCLALGPVSYAESDNIVYRAKVLGGAKANWGDTCADLLVPPAGVCDESYLTFYTHGDGKPLKDSTWFVFVETYRLTFDGINADPVDDFTLRSGFVQLSEGSFAVDTARLGSASLDVSIPMVTAPSTTLRARGSPQANGCTSETMDPKTQGYRTATTTMLA